MSASVLFKTYQILYCYMPSPTTQNFRHNCNVVSGSQIGTVSREHAGIHRCELAIVKAEIVG